MQRVIKGLLLGSIIGVIGVLFGLSAPGTIFERNLGLDWLFNMRGKIEPPPGAVVIAIDRSTGAKLGIPSLPREWPRSIHGDLVDRLSALGVSAIVFDIDFHKQRSQREERIFADAIKRSNRVVLLQRLTGKGQPLENEAGIPQGGVWVEELLSPIPVLADGARGMGPFPLPKQEASVHEFWVFKSGSREAPTIPAVGLQVHALKAYSQFHRLLTDAGITEYIEIPQSAEQISTSRDMRDLMISIRTVLFEEPLLAADLELVLHRPWVEKESREIRRLLAALVSTYIGSNERYLNFYGPAGTIETLPYQDIVNSAKDENRLPDTDLAGKVAFIGFSDLYDPVQPDRFHTVFTNRERIDLSGVEIAATAFTNLLHGQSLRVPGAGTLFVLLFVFGLVTTVLIYLMPAVFGVPLSAIGITAYVIYAQLLFNTHYLWLPLATPVMVQFPLALFIGLLIQYLQQRHQVRHISQAMRYFVPEDVSRALTSNDFKPQSIDKVTYSTCLATDMQGFSSIAENMEPAELAEFLNDYFDALAKPLRDHGVTVTEFRADAIMCAWTGDESDIEIRRKPLLASLQAVDALEDFRARHTAFETSLRIGMASGEVYVGHAGGGGYYGYSIVGDCANAASRIEGLNKFLKTQVLATTQVIAKIDSILSRPLGRFAFVGKAEALPVVEIIGLASEAGNHQVELAERFSKCIESFGRGDWEAAASGFRAILKNFPQDGPSQFYLSQCHARINAQVPVDDPDIINLSEK